MNENITDVAVRLSNVTKYYSIGSVQVKALRNVTLSIRTRRFTTIIGASGSGKTTLLNLIGCMDVPTAGDVMVCGRNIGELDDNALSDLRAHDIGFIFQNFSLIATLSAYENVEFPLLMTGVSKGERRDRTSSILESVGLADSRSRRPNELSGGQMQRVAIARALVKGPRIVIADEPTANLDSHTGMAIIELMREMQESKRTTFIFSTHDRQLIANSDELISLLDGQLIESTESRAL